MPQQESYVPKYTYDDYQNWEGRWEIIEGHAIAMSLLPIPEHQRVAAEIRFQFMLELKANKCSDCKAYDPLDYKIEEDTIVQPDVLIVCGKINKKYLDFTPTLVAEILSPSTMIKDKNKKFQLYEREGIKYYLLVDPDKKQVDIYKLENGRYRLEPENRNYEFYFGDNCRVIPQLQDIWND